MKTSQKTSIYNTYMEYKVLYYNIRNTNQTKNGPVCNDSAVFHSIPLPPDSAPAPPAPGVAYPDQLHLFTCSRCHICPLHHTHGVELTKLWDTRRERQTTNILLELLQ